MTTITQEPRQIAFDDIRKGDLIRLEYPTASGIKVTRRGEAFERRPDGAWYTSEGGYVAAPFTTGTIILLSRPAPAEPKGLGAVVRAAVGESMVDPRLVRTLVRTANRDFPWADEGGTRWEWSDFDPDSIEVLSEGVEVPRGSEVTS